MIHRDDPLYGVLSDEQVGLDPATGRRKINPEVLQNMREYLLAAEGGEKRVREERVRTSVVELSDDPNGQKMFLRLEGPPVVICDLDKDKGVVFDYALKNVENQVALRRSEGNVNKSLVIRDFQSSGPDVFKGKAVDHPLSPVFFECPTGFSSGFSDANSSGTSRHKGGKRYRPPKRMRKKRVAFRFDKRLVGKNRVEETIGEAWKRARGNN
ncbi:unnamed protein product, partial [Brassica rapa subsp. trilocularis]